MVCFSQIKLVIPANLTVGLLAVELTKVGLPKTCMYNFVNIFKIQGTVIQNKRSAETVKKSQISISCHK